MRELVELQKMELPFVRPPITCRRSRLVIVLKLPTFVAFMADPQAHHVDNVTSYMKLYSSRPVCLHHNLLSTIRENQQLGYLGYSLTGGLVGRSSIQSLLCMPSRSSHNRDKHHQTGQDLRNG